MRVKVLLTGGGYHVVEADSFGRAASMVKVGRGSILRFEWTDEEVGVYNASQPA